MTINDVKRMLKGFTAVAYTVQRDRFHGVSVYATGTKSRTEYEQNMVAIAAYLRNQGVSIEHTKAMPGCDSNIYVRAAA